MGSAAIVKRRSSTGQLSVGTFPAKQFKSNQMDGPGPGHKPQIRAWAGPGIGTRTNWEPGPRPIHLLGFLSIYI